MNNPSNFRRYIALVREAEMVIERGMIVLIREAEAAETSEIGMLHKVHKETLSEESKGVKSASTRLQKK